MTNPLKDNILGHHQNRWVFSDSHREKMRINHVGMTGKHHSEETRQRLYTINKEHPTLGMRGKHHSEETKKRMSVAHKGKILSEEHIRKLKENASKRRPYTEERRNRMRLSMLGKNIGKSYLVSEETKRKLRAKWLDPYYVRKQMIGRHVSPNKPEAKLLEILNILFPGDWKFTGDLSFTINGKCPDFVNCNGQKKIIELFGNYWHRGENEEDRKKIFSPFGYQTLIVWEKELKDQNKLIGKLQEFCGV